MIVAIQGYTVIQVNVGLHFRWWPSRTHILVLHEPRVAAIGSPASVAERPLQLGDADTAATGSPASVTGSLAPVLRKAMPTREKAMPLQRDPKRQRLQGEMAGAVAEGGAAGGDRNRVCFKISVWRGKTCVAR